jgi:predicted peroxiredoxin
MHTPYTLPADEAGRPKEERVARKIVFMVTHGADDPERATIPFVMAVTAQASGAEAVLGFQAEGVTIARKGGAEKISSPPFPSLKDLLDGYLKAGGKLLVCGPCMQTRGITAADLIEGATQVNAAVFIAEILEATNALVY